MNLTARIQIHITGECVCLQYAGEVGKVTMWMFVTTIRRIGTPDGWRFVRTTGPIIAHTHPEQTGPRHSVARREHRQRRVVDMNLGAGKRVAAYGVGKRVESPCLNAPPVAHGARFELDADTRI